MRWTNCTSYSSFPLSLAARRKVALPSLPPSLPWISCLDILLGVSGINVSDGHGVRGSTAGLLRVASRLTRRCGFDAEGVDNDDGRSWKAVGAVIAGGRV